MFHSSDWLAIWPQRRGATHGPVKTIGMRDLYTHEGQRLGSIQSTGMSADYGNVLLFLRGWFDRSAFRHLRFVRPFLRIPARIATRLFGSATIFAMIIEDVGLAENRWCSIPRGRTASPSASGSARISSGARRWRGGCCAPARPASANIGCSPI